jgi:hypothetical protein
MWVPCALNGVMFRSAALKIERQSSSQSKRPGQKPGLLIFPTAFIRAIREIRGQFVSLSPSAVKNSSVFSPWPQFPPVQHLLPPARIRAKKLVTICPLAIFLPPCHQFW